MSSKVHHGDGARARARKAMLKSIGARVRALRDSQGLPRRTLADLSGVSARFLAQLETGSGNISVARLADVAHALGSTPAALLGGRATDATSTVRAEIAALLDPRTDAELAEVLPWLAGRFARATGPRVALLGLRGAGKSTIGRAVAERLNVPFAELDQLVEKSAGLTLAEMFQLHGEAYYRRLERETLASYLGRHERGVLATGGGIVLDRESFALLRGRALTVWLKARPEDHWARVVSQGDRRPMAEHPHAMAELRALLAARERLYAEADVTVDTSAQSVDDAVARIVAALGERDAGASLG